MAKPTVLVVEDDYFIAQGMASAFAGAGYDVLGPVASAAAALDVAREACPQLTVMDVRLQGAPDGVAAAQDLRALCDCPILFHTAHADPATTARIRSVPKAELLRKPAPAAALLQAARDALARAPSQPGPAAHGSPAVLVVDDDEMVRETLQRILEQAGARVVQARDGLEAVALFAAERFDMVFCDIVMPRGGGIEALRAFKRLAPEAPVVVMTGAPPRARNGEPIELAAARAGAAQILRKPFRVADVRSALRRFAGHRAEPNQ